MYLVPGMSCGCCRVCVRLAVLLRAICWLILVPRERNGKGACCSHNAYLWSQLPVCQVRGRPKSTNGYPTSFVPGTWYLSRMPSCVGVRYGVLLRVMCRLISVPRERNAHKGACCSHLLIMVPTYQGARCRCRRLCYSWSNYQSASHRCRRTWTCRNRHLITSSTTF